MPRPWIGTALVVAALSATGLAGATWRPGPPSVRESLLLLGLMAAVVSSRWLRVRVGAGAVLYFSSIPLYLLCCLFVPSVAAAATGASMLVREILACRRCTGNTAGVIGAQVGRWAVVSGLVSAVVHLIPAEYVLYAGTLAGALLWLGDVGTAPAVFTPVTGQPPFQVIREVARQSYAGELMQYLIALFALALLQSETEWIAIVYIPVIVLCVFLLYLYVKSTDEARQRSRGPVEAGVVER